MNFIRTLSKKQKISFISIISIIIISSISIPIILHNSNVIDENQPPPSKPKILESLLFSNNSDLDMYFKSSKSTGLSYENAYQLKNLVFNTTQIMNPHYSSFSFQHIVAISLINTTRFVDIINCTFEGYSDAISLRNSENIKVSNCSFKQCIDSIDSSGSRKIQIKNNSRSIENDP